MLSPKAVRTSRARKATRTRREIETTTSITAGKWVLRAPLALRVRPALQDLQAPLAQRVRLVPRALLARRVLRVLPALGVPPGPRPRTLTSLPTGRSTRTAGTSRL